MEAKQEQRTLKLSINNQAEIQSTTGALTISEPQNQVSANFIERRATDSDAPKLWNGLSGIASRRSSSKKNERTNERPSRLCLWLREKIDE